MRFLLRCVRELGERDAAWPRFWGEVACRRWLDAQYLKAYRRQKRKLWFSRYQLHEQAVSLSNAKLEAVFSSLLCDEASRFPAAAEDYFKSFPDSSLREIPDSDPREDDVLTWQEREAKSILMKREEWIAARSSRSSSRR